MNRRIKRLGLSLLTLGAMMLVASAALADNGAADNEFTMKGLVGLAAGLGIGIAAFGGALGQGKTAAAALEGIARNPSAGGKLFTPMILGLALIESLVIYALVITYLLQTKV